MIEIPPQRPIKRLMKQSCWEIGSESLNPFIENSSGKHSYENTQKTKLMIIAASIGCHLRFHSTPSEVTGLNKEKPHIEMNMEHKHPDESKTRGK